VENYRAVYLEGTRNVLAWLRAHPPARYIYTSSTSVYSQNDGSIVTEQSSTEPENDTSKVLRETEEVLLTQTIVPAIVLRTSGIYGPGRGHLFKQYLRGEAIMRDDGLNYINMAHVEDVAGAIEACFTKGGTQEIYNLTDDEPVTQLDFFAWLSQQLGKPLPPSAPPDPQRKRGVSNKRVSNAKLKSAVGYAFRYPTFREGYAPELARLGGL
jgi:nucleoside-diphosphate-sugar epimerase